MKAEDIQCDEIWSFISKKNKRVKDHEEGAGDTWTFVGVERNTKLIHAYHVAGRDADQTDVFLNKLARSVDQTTRIQISTDGWGAYKYGVPFAMGGNIDFGMLVKKYAAEQVETRYSPATIIAAEKVPVFGNPDEDKICTSHIESLNQKIRMHLKRFCRLTAAHSKSIDHHVAMQNVFFCWYNFCRNHSTIGSTPAMACGIADKRLNLVDVLSS